MTRTITNTNLDLGPFIESLQPPVVVEEKVIQDYNLEELLKDSQFPPEVVLVEIASERKHLCWCERGLHGVGCFSSERHASTFLEFMPEITGAILVTLSFDEAREVAKSKQPPICCLHLLDDPSNIKTHYTA